MLGKANGDVIGQLRERPIRVHNERQSLSEAIEYRARCLSASHSTELNGGIRCIQIPLIRFITGISGNDDPFSTIRNPDRAYQFQPILTAMVLADEYQPKSRFFGK